MKKVILAALIVYSIQLTYAQKSSKNISRGTWVVESNIAAPKNQVVKFYNSRNELIYEESISNRRVRYEKERIKKALDKTLEIALSNEESIMPGTFSLLLRSKKIENSKAEN